MKQRLNLRTIIASFAVFMIFLFESWQHGGWVAVGVILGCVVAISIGSQIWQRAGRQR